MCRLESFHAVAGLAGTTIRALRQLAVMGIAVTVGALLKRQRALRLAAPVAFFASDTSMPAAQRVSSPIVVEPPRHQIAPPRRRVTLGARGPESLPMWIGVAVGAGGEAERFVVRLGAGGPRCDLLSRGILGPVAAGAFDVGVTAREREAGARVIEAAGRELPPPRRRMATSAIGTEAILVRVDMAAGAGCELERSIAHDRSRRPRFHPRSRRVVRRMTARARDPGMLAGERKARRSMFETRRCPALGGMAAGAVVLLDPRRELAAMHIGVTIGTTGRQPQRRGLELQMLRSTHIFRPHQLRFVTLVAAQRAVPAGERETGLAVVEGLALAIGPADDRHRGAAVLGVAGAALQPLAGIEPSVEATIGGDAGADLAMTHQAAVGGRGLARLMALEAFRGAVERRVGTREFAGGELRRGGAGPAEQQGDGHEDPRSHRFPHASSRLTPARDRAGDAAARLPYQGHAYPSQMAMPMCNPIIE